MKRFTEYLNEDFDPAIYNSDGGISIEDPTVVDAINSNLEVATACACRTPYNSLEEIRKVLAYYKIFLPKSIFLDQTDGNDVFEISQFGEKTGMNNQGEVVTASESSLFVYFEWSVNERGMYDTFACVCNQEELDDILADFDSETGDDINEQVMPDLKKKMGAKKVTLPNMMRKEENETPPWREKGQEAEGESKTPAGESARRRKKITKKLAKKATPSKKIEEAKRVVTATKKAEKGTKFKLISRRPDSEGSDMELRQGKRVKMLGGFYRDSQDFGMLPTKKGKMNMKAKSQYFDSPADIMKTVKEEQLDEISRELAKKAENKAAKKYYDAYDDETKAREELQKKKTPEARKGAEGAKAKRTKAAKRVMKFQQYADKKKVNEVLEDPKKRAKYIRDAGADRDQAIDDRDHYKKNLTDPNRAWTKGIPHKDSQYKMAVDRNKRAMKRKKGIERAEKKKLEEANITNMQIANAANRGDKALNKKYGYGTVKGGISPIAGNRKKQGFGAVANWNSAKAALSTPGNPRTKANAVHIGWGKTVDQMPAPEPKQSDRKKLQKTPFFQLTKKEQEKDEVLANAIRENKNVPWDTKEGDDKPSTPYKNPKSKAEQLARAAMNKAKTEKK
jgi:hypothetical protein